MIPLFDPPTPKVVSDHKEVPIDEHAVAFEVDVHRAPDVNGNFVHTLEYEGVACWVQTVEVLRLRRNLQIEDDVVQVIIAVEAQDAAEAEQFSADFVFDHKGYSGKKGVIFAGIWLLTECGDEF